MHGEENVPIPPAKFGSQSIHIGIHDDLPRVTEVQLWVISMHLSSQRAIFAQTAS